MINSDPPKNLVFTSFSKMMKEFDAAVEEIQSTFNMYDAIMKKGNKSANDEKLIAGGLATVSGVAPFLNKLALGGDFVGPISVAANSVTLAVGSLLMLSNNIRRKKLNKFPEWEKLMGSNIEIIYGNQKKEVNLKEFCINPEDTFKKAFGIDDLSDAEIKIFNRTKKEIAEASVKQILKAGAMAKDIHTSIKWKLVGIGGLAGLGFGVPLAEISMGYSPGYAKNRPENRQQIIKPNVVDLTAVPRRRLKPRN